MRNLPWLSEEEAADSVLRSAGCLRNAGDGGAREAAVGSTATQTPLTTCLNCSQHVVCCNQGTLEARRTCSGARKYSRLRLALMASHAEPAI